MKDDTFVAILVGVCFAVFVFLLIFFPVRAAISGPNYNYTDYCVDRFGEGFRTANHPAPDLMKCYAIEDGDMVEKVFKVSLAHESATCKNQIGFWELNKWKFTYCNWEDEGELDG